MTINIQKFNEVAEAAKARTNDKRWQNAIDKAVAGVVSGWWIITELADGVMVTTETGNTYHANGKCGCKAYKNGQPCKHRSLARLIELYNEAEADDVAAIPAPEKSGALKSGNRQNRQKPADERDGLIAEIKNIWPRFAPDLPLATELMARFGKNKLEMLDDDLLRRVRLAIAM